MGAARFTVINPVCVRMEYSPRGVFVDDPTLLAWQRGVGGRGVAPVVVPDAADAEPLTISTERLELVYSPSVASGGAGLTRERLRVRVRGPLAAGGAPVDWRPGDAQRGNLGGTVPTLDGVRGALPLPDGLLSRDGWFLIDDSHGHVLVDGWARVRERVKGEVDWYLFCYGCDYRAAMRAFTEVSGPVPAPRRCLLGSWYSRYWPHSSEEYRQIVAEYDEHGVPLDVMVLDMDWHREGWTGWSWNRDLLPDAESLLGWFHERGLAVTLNLHPADGVGPHEDRYAAFMHAIGRDASRGETVPFDAGDRRQMRALFDQVHAPLERDGVDFWWVDWQQDKFVRSIHGLTNLQWLNKLYFDHTSRDGRRGVSFSRWAGESDEGRWGDHRHPIHFSGDAHTGWAMLAFQVPFTAVAGNVGCFFWSHDIGGHFGPRIEEATARWVQFGALSAAVRLHSARTGVLDRRPWMHQTRFFESMRAALRMRSELMPSLYTQVLRSCATSTPLLRPMYWDWPREERAYGCPGQYMLGEHLLAAPVVERGIGQRCVATRSVWFPPAPEGVARAWRRWSTGERFVGGDEAIVAAEIDEVPLFVPEGVPVVLQPPTLRMAAACSETLRVHVWAPVDPAASAYEVMLAEDDGISAAIDESARTPVRVEWGEVGAAAGGAVGVRRLTVTIGPTVGHLAGQSEQREYTIEIAGAHEFVHAEAEGRRIAGDRVSAPGGGLVRVVLRLASIRSARSAVIDLKVADAEGHTFDHAARRFCAAFDESLPPDAVSTESALRERMLAACGDPPEGSVDAAGGGGAAAARALAIGAGIGLVDGRAMAAASSAGAGERADAGAWRVCDTFGWIDGERAGVEVVDVVGPRTRGWGRGALALKAGGAGRSRTAAVPMPETPLAAPPIGLRAVRLARVECEIGGRPVGFAATLRTLLTPVDAGAWRVVGPFGWDWSRSIGEQVYSPEIGGGQGLRERDWHENGDGAWLSWRSAVAGERWPVDFRGSLHSHSGLGYAVTCITSSRRQRARLVVDSADKVEVWLNQARVYSQNGFDTAAALDGGTDVVLPQGRSVVLVKCASGGGGWGFSLAIDGEREVAADADPDHAAMAARPRAG